MERTSVFCLFFFLNHDVDPCCEGQRRFLPKLNLVWNETFFCIKETFHLSFLLPSIKTLQMIKLIKKTTKKKQCLPLSLCLQFLYDFFLDIVQRVKVLSV